MVLPLLEGLPSGILLSGLGTERSASRSRPMTAESLTRRSREEESRPLVLELEEDNSESGKLVCLLDLLLREVSLDECGAELDRISSCPIALNH